MKGNRFETVNRAARAISVATRLFSRPSISKRIFGPVFRARNGILQEVIYRVSDRDIPHDTVWLKMCDKELICRD